jgi:hypothetical protein
MTDRHPGDRRRQEARLRPRSPWLLALIVPLCLSMTLPIGGGARAQDAGETTRTHLYAGTIKTGEAALADLVAQNPGDANARFDLGIVRFTRAIEYLGRSLHRYGLRAPKQFGVPILRMPVPENLDPEPLTYEAFRAVLQNFVDDLGSADAALAAVPDAPVKLTLDVYQIRLDLVGDGVLREEGRLWSIFAGVARGGRNLPDDHVVTLDKADAHWLRGYCNMMMAFTEWWLAYDSRDMFDASFGLFFPRAGLADRFARDEDRKRADMSGISGADIAIADVISLIHLMHWPVVEPERMGRSRDHLLTVIKSSRATWAAILARKDDDRHWLPGPGQKGILQGVNVTPERVDAWLRLLDEAESVLEGRKLVPHWRFSKGLNIKRVFTEPRTFDLVLWLTGPGARPFLESGEVIPAKSWNQMLDAFGGDFLTYAFWFN